MEAQAADAVSAVSSPLTAADMTSRRSAFLRVMSLDISCMIPPRRRGARPHVVLQEHLGTVNTAVIGISLSSVDYPSRVSSLMQAQRSKIVEHCGRCRDVRESTFSRSHSNAVNVHAATGLRTISSDPMIPVRRLLKSWAMPLVSWPIVSIFWD
jgi:hypothetical protein